MNETELNKIYDVLVGLGGAPEIYRDDFIYHHLKNDCDEFRFQGKLGFGGKYRSKTNSVDCYLEDSTPERLKLIDEINEELKQQNEIKSSNT
jgi:hypothetical protein